MNSNQLLHFGYHPAASRLVETIWHSQSHQAGPFLSVATSHWEMVVSHYAGKTCFSVRGPETHSTVAQCPAGGEWLGIQFKHGVFMPQLPVSHLVNGEVELPQAAGRSFWLASSTWELPTVDNADVFIARLIKAELLVCDPIIATALQDRAIDLSPRSVQRRFLRTTGLTQGTISQIERARYAVSLLRQGHSILDTVALAGYADQPHLTRALKRLIGQTPVQLRTEATAMPTSFVPILSLSE
jgi:AraC-like DNA-binding protein